jgi:hypothetical protein
MHGSRSKIPGKILVHIYTLNFWLYYELHIYDTTGLRVKVISISQVRVTDDVIRNTRKEKSRCRREAT